MFRTLTITALSVFIIVSCKKPELQTQKDQTAVATKKKALFTVKTPCPITELILYDSATIQYVNSNFLFENKSDTGQVSYAWNFGDGITSTEVSPLHSYNNVGKYKVSLVTYFNGQPSDTTSTEVHVILGAHEFTTGADYVNGDYIDGLDVAESKDRDFLTLVYQQPYPWLPDLPKYGLVKTDSFFNQIWWKNFPKATNYLNGISANSDGTFILSGNYEAGNTNDFALSKIDKNGNSIWTKYYPTTGGRTDYSMQTSDGGFIMAGHAKHVAPNGASYYFTLVIKTDQSGNEQWRYSFDNGTDNHLPHGTLNLVEVNNVYYIPAVFSTGNTDTIIVVTLDNAGYETMNVKLDTLAHNPGTNGWPVGIAYTNNRLLVYTEISPQVFVSDLAFANPQKMSFGGMKYAVGYDGIFYAYYQMWGPTGGDYLRAYSIFGDQIWERLMKGSTKNPDCTISTGGVGRVPVVIKKTSTNHLLLLDFGRNGFIFPQDSKSAYLRKLTMGGLYY